MSIKTSNTDFKTRIRQQIEDPIMRKAVANAQQRIGANRRSRLVCKNQRRRYPLHFTGCPTQKCPEGGEI